MKSTIGTITLLTSGPLRMFDTLPQPSVLLIARPATLAFVLLISACSGGTSVATSGEDGETSVPGGNDAETSVPSDNDAETSLPSMDDIVDVSDPTQCGQATQNQWAYDAMLDTYLFFDRVPDGDPQAYASADALVRDVRYEVRDVFSDVTDAAQANLAYEEGREFGLGAGLQVDDDDAIRISYVFTDSPIGRAGIERGDIIISVNDIPSRTLLLPEMVNTIIGTPDNPATSTWQFQKAATEELVDVELTSTEYDINTVLNGSVITNDNIEATVGYLVINRFLSTSMLELTEQFNSFRENGITDLILDLRYNSGGLISVAAGLASAIGGEALAGQPLYEYRYNDMHTDKNETLTFLEGLGDLNLGRVIVLTSEQTASASELVIAGLQPYMDVVIIGTPTFGEPYVSFPNERCGERLNAIEAEGFNAAAVSVSGGIPVNCTARDDLSTNFGSSQTGGGIEGHLLAALNYIVDEDNCTRSFTFSRLPDTATELEEHLHLGYGLKTVNGAVGD